MSSTFIFLTGTALVLLKQWFKPKATSNSSPPASSPIKSVAGPGQIVNRYGDVEDEANLRPVDWSRRWQQNQTGWHKTEVNETLTQHAPKWRCAAQAQAVRDGKADPRTAPVVFVPLCGKSIDLVWLYQQGYRVVGVEFCTQAIIDFFLDNPSEFPAFRSERLPSGLYVYTAGRDDRLRIIQSDILSPHITPELVCAGSNSSAGADAVWDRASLVAMNPHTRQKYARTIERVSRAPTSQRPGAEQLLIVFHYDQSLMHGPPFSTPESVVRELYPQAQGWKITKIEEQNTPFSDRAAQGGPNVPAKSIVFTVEKKMI